MHLADHKRNQEVVHNLLQSPGGGYKSPRGPALGLWFPQKGQGRWYRWTGLGLACLSNINELWNLGAVPVLVPGCGATGTGMYCPHMGKLNTGGDWGVDIISYLRMCYGLDMA